MRRILIAFSFLFFVACHSETASTPSTPKSTASTQSATANHAPNQAQPISAHPQTADVAIEVSLKDAAQHYAEVDVIIPAEATKKPFVLATWTPGSYLIREYARNIEQVFAFDASGKSVAIRKIEKNRWQLDSPSTTAVRLRYRTYGREFSVRTNFFDADGASLIGAATYIVPENPNNFRYTVKLKNMPESWKTSVSGLEEKGTHHFVAQNYDELVDSPIVIGAELSIDNFESHGKPHRLVYWGDASKWDRKKAQADVQAFVDAQISFWGDVPYERYTFITLFQGGRAGGGLEHLNSTLVITHPLATQHEDGYKRWRGTMSHEFFHTWNVKRLRPKALGPFDYEKEVHTRSLWIAEGITSYYDDLFLLRSGILDESDYLELLSKAIKRYQNKPGRFVQSLSDSSFDAWIKFYRHDENSANTQVSYYNKGSLVALLLDHEIRKSSRDARSLDDVMRAMYAQFPNGYLPTDFRTTCNNIAGRDLSEFFARYVDGLAELDFEPMLQYYGLALETKTADMSLETLGISTRDGIVSEVKRNTPAYDAGVNVDDELLAIDGYRITTATEPALLHLADDKPRAVSLMISRRDRIRTLSMTLHKPSATTAKLVSKSPTSAQRKRREAWMRQNQQTASQSH